MSNLFWFCVCEVRVGLDVLGLDEVFWVDVEVCIVYVGGMMMYEYLVDVIFAYGLMLFVVF